MPIHKNIAVHQTVEQIEVGNTANLLTLLSKLDIFLFIYVGIQRDKINLQILN